MEPSQQSPIDLTDPVVTDYGKNQLQIRWKRTLTGTISGCHVDFNADDRQYIVLDRRRFYVVQFHFHHPSEHWVNGKQRTMELHVVHQDATNGDRAVLGIFIEPDRRTATVPDLITRMLAGSGDGAGEQISTNPRDFLPPDTEHYYRYEGSLTTPPYTENVSWVVFREPLLLPKREVAALIKRFGEQSRLPQALNRRFILANFAT